MRITLGKILLLFAGLFILFVGLTVILVNLKKEFLYEKAIGELQRSLKAEVNGDLHISVFKSFPKVSIKLAGVVVKDPASPDEEFLNVDALTLKIYPWSLFNNSYDLSEIDIENGTINIVRNKSGEWNLGIFNVTNKNESKEVWKINDAILLNMAIRYRSENGNNPVEILYHIETGKISGNISSRRSDIFSMVKGRFTSVPENFSALTTDDSKIKLNLKGWNDFKKIQISNGNMVIAGNHIDVDAYIGKADSSHFHASSSGKKIEKALSFLPSGLVPFLNNFKGNANYNVKISSQKFASLSKANWKIHFKIDDGEVSNPELGQKLDGLTVDGRVNIFPGDKDSSRLEIKEFRIKDRKNDLHGEFAMTPFYNPVYKVKLDGRANLEKIKEYIPDTLLTKLAGQIDFDEFHVVASKDDFEDIEDSRLKVNGNMDLDNIELTYNQIQFDKINGQLEFDNRAVAAHNFLIQFFKTDLEFDGKLSNLLEYFFNVTQNRGSEGTPLIAEGRLNSQQLDIKSIIDGFSANTHKNKNGDLNTPKVSGVALEQVFNFQGNLKTRIDRLLFDKLELENINSHLKLEPANIVIKELNCLGMQGQIISKGSLLVSNRNSITLELDANVTDIKIQELFRQCNNFGQEVLKDENLEGDLHADIHFISRWNNITQLDEDAIEAKAIVNLENGRLRNFEPLTALSKHVSLDDLKDIKFASLQNTIQIENSTITIPGMEVLSNIIKIQMSGTHKFNNWVDYRFKLNLKSLLAKKFNKNKSWDAMSEPLPEGGLNLYLQMIGDLADPEISFDKEGRKEKIKEDFKKQKEDFKNLFKEDSIDEFEKKEKEHFIIKEKQDYIIWDDEGDSTDAESLNY